MSRFSLFATRVESSNALALSCLLVALVLSGCEKEVALPTTPVEAPAVEGPVSDADLAARVDSAIRVTENRVLDINVNNAWQVVHGILAYGPNLKMTVDGKDISALRFLFDGNTMKGWNLYPTTHGLEAELRPGSSEAQGHPDQWIGYLSQCGVKLDDPIVITVDKVKQPHKFREMIEQAKWNIHEGMEATWTLMAFAEYSSDDYLPIFGTWKNSTGQEWTLEKLVGMEADAGIEGAACGGSHRLYALAEAVKLYKKTGKPLTGGWEKADKVVKNAIQKAREYQQPDGGFSTNKFYSSRISADVDSRIDSTGHVLEVLAYALDDEELRSPWFTRAVLFLTKKIDESKNIPISCGGLYHGAHGLMLYRDRRFGKPAGVVAK
ncbi:MAG: hypothetical protein K8U03_20905 [Planctomycetia bacterium]|nr:hypothetical protein [Planctomycetia bacterium]